MSLHRYFALKGFFGDSDNENTVTIKNQNKTIVENGTYKADAGYTGLGTVVVAVPDEEYHIAEDMSF